MSDYKKDDYIDSADYRRTERSNRRPKRESSKEPDNVDIKDFEKIYVHSSNPSTSAKKSANSPKPKKAPQQQQQQQHKSNKTKKKGTRIANMSIFKKILIAILALIILCVLTAVGIVIAIVSNAEEIDPTKIYDVLSESSVMYDSSGEAIENVVNSELRTNLSYDEMPKDLINAFVAIEDKTFWKHHGFNFIRIAGAIWESITSGDSISGTSTITQQLARNAYLPDVKSDRNMVRKITEAYYTILIERSLTKEQIIEAYLNTIYLGFNTYGVEAASRTYFGIPASEMNLAQCSALATITQNPTKNALIKRLYTEEVDSTNPNIITTQGVYTLLYNDEYKTRQAYVLNFMVENGTATQAEADAAYAFDLMSTLNPPDSLSNSITATSYYTDYAKDEAVALLMETLNVDKARATEMLYTGGLHIYTSLDMDIQTIVEDAYNQSANFPNVSYSRKDSSGNIVNSKREIMLYNYNTYFNSDESFTLNDDEYSIDSSGNLTLYRDKRLNFYTTTQDDESTDISIRFKPIYRYKSSSFYIINGGTVNIPQEYKTYDSEKNVVISAAFLDEHPNFFIESGSNFNIASENFTLSADVMQPQSAMVIMDQYTGEIKAMVGGRNIEGRQLLNRANSPRQPGSSIKPLAVYTPALLMGMTGATIIPDTPNYENGKLWPKNSGGSYRGDVTLRRAVQSSLNVVSVRVLKYVGYQESYDMLEKLGITTLDKDDLNPAALGLGGLTNGLKPVESCAAYATIANGGTYNKPTTVQKIVDRNNNIIYELPTEGERVIDEGTAFIMTDILKGVVSGGTGSSARIYSNNSTIPVAGKTGTTTANYDAWFCGYTPYYTAVIWIGNDYNIQLSNGSGAAARLWSKVMSKVHDGLEAKSFEQPDSVVSSHGEYSVEGRDKISGRGSGGSYRICATSGRLARAGCPNTYSCASSIFTPKPTAYCNIHSNAAPVKDTEEPTDTDTTDGDDTEDPDTGDEGTAGEPTTNEPTTN